VRLGIFGGTFDPPHVGHLIVAQDAVRALHLDRIAFVPAALPPHKRGVSITAAALRLGMVRAAVAGDDRFAVDDIEVQRDGPSYTVDTLRAYRERYPDAELFLLLGADQYADFETWREAAEIRKLAAVAVLARQGESGTTTGDDLDEGGEDGANRPLHVTVTRIDISSTDIRRRVAAGEPIRYLVPSPVERLIRECALYAPPAGAAAPNRTAVAG
jgi:nicotinate-nucleotide adenylyltransferase